MLIIDFGLINKNLLSDIYFIRVIKISLIQISLTEKLEKCSLKSKGKKIKDKTRQLSTTAFWH